MIKTLPTETPNLKIYNDVIIAISRISFTVIFNKFNTQL